MLITTVLNREQAVKVEHWAPLPAPTALNAAVLGTITRITALFLDVTTTTASVFVVQL